MKVYNCSNCGATLYFNNKSKVICEYCGSEVHKENNEVQEECCLDNIELIEVERNMLRLDYIAYFKDKSTNEYININFKIDIDGNIEITKNETDIEDRIFKKELYLGADKIFPICKELKWI